MDERTDERLLIEVDRNQASPVVRLVGEVDPHTAAELEGALDELLAGAADRIVLDLAGLRFIDSSGLRVLIGTSNRLRDREGELVLARPSTTVVRLLEITGLLDQLPIEDDI